MSGRVEKKDHDYFFVYINERLISQLLKHYEGL